MKQVTDNRVDDKLYALAMQCARLNDKGCNRACESCQFNVFNYVSDVREAALLKATAYTDYYNQAELYKQVEQSHIASNISALLVTAIVLAPIIWFIILIGRCFSGG